MTTAKPHASAEAPTSASDAPTTATDPPSSTRAPKSTVARSDAAVPGLDWPAIVAAGVAIVLWASAFVGIRAVAPELSPGGLAVGRVGVGALTLGLVVAAKRPSWPERRWLPSIVVAGVLWYGIYNIVLNTGERYVDAGTAAMLVNVGPLLIALFSGLFLGEGFPPRLWAGLAVAFAGAVTIGLATSGGGAPPNAALGAALCLLSALLFAAGVTIQKPVVAHVPALMVTWLLVLVGFIACLPFAPDLVRDLATASPTSVAWMVYLGLFPTSIGFTAWAFALNRTAAGRLGSTTYLVPVVAVVMAWLVLGEVPPALAIVGGVIAIAGVAVARSRPRRLAQA